MFCMMFMGFASCVTSTRRVFTPKSILKHYEKDIRFFVSIALGSCLDRAEYSLLLISKVHGTISGFGQ